ncbi:hypothetical protein CsatB_009937 [Cannabis sativa]
MSWLRKANYEDKDEVEQVVAEENAEFMRQIVGEVTNDLRAIKSRFELILSEMRSLEMAMSKKKRYSPRFCKLIVDELKRFQDEASHIKDWFGEITEKVRLIEQLQPAFMQQNNHF